MRMKIGVIAHMNHRLIEASLDLSSNETRKMSELISRRITTVFPPNKLRIKGFKVAIHSKIALRHLVRDQIDLARQEVLMTLQLLQTSSLELMQVLNLELNLKDQ